MSATKSSMSFTLDDHKSYESSTALMGSANAFVVEESEELGLMNSPRSDSRNAPFSPKPVSKNNLAMKNNKVLQDLTINKLNYKAIGLVGREEEIKAPTACIEKAGSPTDLGDRSKHLVLIQGYSGVGKSSLVAAVRAHVHQSGGTSGLAQMAHGKFDLQNYDEPYSGIASVFDEVCANILSGVEKGDSDCIAISNRDSN